MNVRLEFSQQVARQVDISCVALASRLSLSLDKFQARSSKHYFKTVASRQSAMICASWYNFFSACAKSRRYRAILTSDIVRCSCEARRERMKDPRFSGFARDTDALSRARATGMGNGSISPFALEKFFVFFFPRLRAFSIPRANAEMQLCFSFFDTYLLMVNWISRRDAFHWNFTVERCRQVDTR